MGVAYRREKDRLFLDATKVGVLEAPYDLVRTMRASILVLGPLLARFGEARVSLPGGCAIGARPIDQHLKGLVRLGAQIDIEHGYVRARAPRGLIGADVVFDMPTVTGTENLMLAATLARGTTTLNNAALEPEIVDLAILLRTMGAKVSGEGTSIIQIEGVTSLKPYIHRVVADRIECGTLLVAAAMCGEDVNVTDCVPEHQALLLEKLRAVGASVEVGTESIRVSRAETPRATDVSTAPFPGFPTDMQAQLMALLSTAYGGTSVITETIFENRFMHVAELDRMGADIRVEGKRAIIKGIKRLSGATVMATDLRASASLVLAALVADGESIVRRIYHLDRGYEHLERKLLSLGAKIERESET